MNESTEERMWATIVEQLNLPDSQILIDTLKQTIPQECDYAGDTMATYIIENEDFLVLLLSLAVSNQHKAFDYLRDAIIKYQVGQGWDNPSIVESPCAADVFCLKLDDYSNLDDPDLVAKVKANEVKDLFPVDDWTFCVPAEICSQFQIDLNKLSIDQLNKRGSSMSSDFEVTLHKDAVFIEGGAPLDNWGNMPCDRIPIEKYGDRLRNPDYATLVISDFDMEPSESVQRSRPFESTRKTTPVNIEAGEEKRCPQCEKPVEQGWSACPFCQYTLKSKCPKCGKDLESQWVACPSCGESVKESKKATQSNVASISHEKLVKEYPVLLKRLNEEKQQHIDNEGQQAQSSLIAWSIVTVVSTLVAGGWIYSFDAGKPAIHMLVLFVFIALPLIIFVKHKNAHRSITTTIPPIDDEDFEFSFRYSGVFGEGNWVTFRYLILSLGCALILQLACGIIFSIIQSLSDQDFSKLSLVPLGIAECASFVLMAAFVAGLFVLWTILSEAILRKLNIEQLQKSEPTVKVLKPAQ